MIVLEDEQLLSTKEAAEFLGVSERTIQNYRKEGILIPDSFGKNNSVFYNKKILIQVVKRLLASGEKLLKFRPQVVKSYEQVVTSSSSSGDKLSPKVETNSSSSNSEKKEKKKIINVNLVPASKLTFPNDKLTKVLFTRSAEQYLNILEHGGEILEKTFPKIGKIVTEYWLELIDKYTDKTPLNMFDKAVLTACTSEWVAGNKYTTPAIIYRHINGKNNGDNAQPSDTIKDLIMCSIKKMMCTQITVDMSEACKHLHYNNDEPLTLTAPILPCQYATGVFINGQKIGTVIEFFKESPLLRIARAKNRQLITIDKKLIDVQSQQNFTNNISVRHYTIQRVQEIKLHKLNPILTFDDIFQKCNLSNASRKEKCFARKTIIEIFHYLQAGGDITSFTIKKKKNKFEAIEFIFSS